MRYTASIKKFTKMQRDEVTWKDEDLPDVYFRYALKSEKKSDLLRRITVTGLLRMVQAGVVVIDYATVAVEMLKDNASPKAGDLYAALDMPWAGLVGQLAGAFASKPTNSA